MNPSTIRIRLSLIVMAFLFVSATQGAARADSVLLSNLAEAPFASTGPSPNVLSAVSFDTGQVGGLLDNVQADIASNIGRTAFGQLRSDLNNGPGALVADLGSVTFAQTGELLATFHASSPVALAAGTRYWFVLSTSGDGVNWSVTASQNYVSPVGWSIGPRTQSNDNGSTWLSPIAGSSPLFALNAPAAVPEPSSLIMVGLAALAGLGMRTRRRRR